MTVITQILKKLISKLNYKKKDDLGLSHYDEIAEHVERHVGVIDNVFHEIVSDLVHIDIIIINPTEEEPNYKLVTSGMSDKPMNYPKDWEYEKKEYVELIFLLPGDWDIKNVHDEKCYWPIRLMKMIAKYPHVFNTFLESGHTIANENYPHFAESTEMSGALLFEPLNYNEEFKVLKTKDGKEIHFLTIFPLYKEEMEYKLEHGFDALLQKMIENKVNFTLDEKRKKVV